VLSATTLWAVSEGRIPALVLVAAMPPIAERVSTAFRPGAPTPAWRFVIGFGVVVAVAAAFYPGALLSLGLVSAAHVVVGARGGRRVVGLPLVLASAAVALVLLFPLTFDAGADGGAALGSTVGTADVALLGRLAPGETSAVWAVAWFLPLAALISFGLVEGEQARPAVRHLLVAVGGVALARASGSGFLPPALANGTAYLVPATFATCSLVVLGVTSALGSMGRRSFGYRQVAVAVLVGLLGGGVTISALLAARADWEVGTDRLHPAWSVVAEGELGEVYRVLWLGADDGRPLPAPAGDPDGVVRTERERIAYALIEPAGRSAVDVGRPNTGEGYDALERAVATLVDSEVSHGGALLAPFAIRFVVAEAGVLPPDVLARLSAQVDLDRITSSDLVLFRNPTAPPRAATISLPGFADAARSGDPLALATLERAADATVPPILPLRWLGTRYGKAYGASYDRYVYVADQDAGVWRMKLVGELSPPEAAFGWATGWPVPPVAEPLTIRSVGQRGWTRQLGVLAVLWAAALWVTRKPASRVGPRMAPVVGEPVAAEPVAGAAP
jgi:hypothetical protein